MAHRFGDFDLDETLYQLRRGRDVVKVEPKVFDVLAYLLRHRERVVSKDELLAKFWPGEFVSEWVLPRSIAGVRRALGETAAGPQTIQTVHGRGYRFIARVAETGTSTHADTDAGDGERAPARPNDGDDDLGWGVFVGRDTIMSELGAALAHARAGRSRLVMLAGEPGIGKTRTAAEIGAIARRHGVAVVTGRCHEGEGAPAFWPWIQVARGCLDLWDAERLAAKLGSAAADVAQLAPDLRHRIGATADLAALPPEQARFRLFDGVARFLHATAEQQPLVLLLDDLHWADKPSLLMLQFLAREVRTAPLLVLGTYRDAAVPRQHPLAQALGELAREPHFLRIGLRGLVEADVARFIELTAGRPATPALVTTVHGMTEGNPFFLTETVRLLMRECGRNDALGMPASLRLPEGVREAIGRRLDTLSDGCNRLLSVASAIGRDFTVPVLTRVLEAPRDATLETLDEAVGAGVVSEVPGTPGQYRFAHALVREVLYEALAPAARGRLHSRIGGVLEDVHRGNPESHLAEIAHHYFQGLVVGDAEPAVAACMRAAEHALTLCAYEEAAGHYARALAALEHTEAVDEAERVAILLGLGDAESSAGERERAREAFRKAADGARILGRPDLLAQAALGFSGRAEFGAGEDPVLLRLLEEALIAVGSGDHPLRAQLLSLLVGTAPYSASLEKRRSLSAEAVAIARRVADSKTLVTALVARYWALLGPDHVDERLAIGTEQLEIADRTRDRFYAFLAHTACSEALLAQGNTLAAAREVDAASDLAVELRQPVLQWTVAVFRASQALSEGRFDDAARLIEEARALGERAQHPVARQLAAVQNVFIVFHRGNADDYARVCAAFIERYPADVNGLRTAMAFFFNELGLTEDARRELETLAADGFETLPRDEHWLICMAQLATVCASLGDERRAAILYELLLPFAHRNTVHNLLRVSNGCVSHYLGVLAATGRRWDEAVRWLEDALATNTRMNVRPYLVRTQLEYARAMWARGRRADRPRARALLAEAADAAEDMGLCRVLSAVRELQRQVDTSLPARRPSRS